MSVDGALEQLTRYGGEPDERVTRLLGLLTELNDDLWNSRYAGLIVEAVEKARSILDEIESNPNLTLSS